MKIAVWIARLVLGVTFLLSGVTKMIDPYGTLTKIEAYLSAWGVDDIVPAGLVLVGGCGLSLFEFIVGMLLTSGSLRRSAPLLAMILMAFMLPLTIYIAAENPVEDCGCFGDFMTISNTATMWKNVVLTALALFLCRYNRRARWIFAPWVQWIQIALGVAYMLILAITGYHEQPLIDFRAYPVGEPLTDVDNGENMYVYQLNGQIQEFSEDNLPDESEGWEFVETRRVRAASEKMLSLFDTESGEEVTDNVIGSSAHQMILLLPYPSEVGAAGSYTANELQQAMETQYGEGSFIAVTAASADAVARMKDLMMATYPVYYADPKAISAVARGNMSVVYLRNDTVIWKRTLSSINPDRLTPDADPAVLYAADYTRLFIQLTLGYIALNFILVFFGKLPYLVRLREVRKK